MTDVPTIGIVAAVVAASAVLAVFAREPARGLYAAIFASAFLITPNLPVVREKLSACEVVMALTWVAVLLRPICLRSPAGPLRLAQRRACWWGAGLIAVASLSFLMGIGFEDVQFAPTAVETANYAYGFLLFLTVIGLANTWDRWFRCLLAWCSGSAAACLVGLWSLLGGAPEWTRDEFTGRLSATFKFSNQLPAYCLPVLALVLVLAARRQTSGPMRVMYLGLAGLIALNVLGTGSRIAFVMLCFTFAAVMWLAGQAVSRREFHQAVFRAVALAMVVGFGWFVASALGQENLAYKAGETPAIQRPLRMFHEWSQGDVSLDTSREEQIAKVLSNVWERPLLGVGPHNFTYVYETDEVHNTYLGVLVEEGFLGLAALIGFLGSVTICGRESLRRSSGIHRMIVLAVFVGFAALLIYGVAMFGLRQRPFWFMCGLIAALPRVVPPLVGGRLAALRARTGERRR